MMNKIAYRPPELGDEYEISACIWASANLWELVDETPESVNEWKQICDPEELRERILSSEKKLVATWNSIVIGFIAFRQRNHLSLLFIRREFSRQGIGKELFTRCSHDFDEITVNSSDLAVGFYKKLGFVQIGDRFKKYGVWATPMKWSNKAVMI